MRGRLKRSPLRPPGDTTEKQQSQALSFETRTLDQLDTNWWNVVSRCTLKSVLRSSNSLLCTYILNLIQIYVSAMESCSLRSSAYTVGDRSSSPVSTQLNDFDFWTMMLCGPVTILLCWIHRVNPLEYWLSDIEIFCFRPRQTKAIKFERCVSGVINYSHYPQLFFFQISTLHMNPVPRKSLFKENGNEKLHVSSEAAATIKKTCYHTLQWGRGCWGWLLLV